MAFLIRQLLVETYSSENSRLFQYLREKPVECSNHWWELRSDWGGWSGVLDVIGVSEEEVEKLSHDPDVFEKLCYRVDRAIEADDSLKNDYAEFMIWRYPDEAPTWAMLDLSAKRLLPPQTWLVHWTNDPVSIARKGFTKGEFDVTLLALTTYRKKSGNGYNFAFRADSGYAENPDRRYGDEFVVFQSSGVECYHGGDEEDQVIFWGQSITSRPVPVIKQDDGFAVYSLKADRSLFTNADPEVCIAWIIKNHRQYASLL